MASGLTSNYNDSGYSFYVPGTNSTNFGDGMMLASRIIVADPSGLLLESRTNTTANQGRNGSNIFYPQPGTRNRVANNNGAEYFSDGTTSGSQNGNINYFYGNFPTILQVTNPTAFVRDGTVTVTPGSDIYNFTNPGVYLVNGGTRGVFPILSSVPNIQSLFEAPINSIDWIIVYPGWGFRAFDGASTGQSSFYSLSWDAISYTYFNDTNQPLVFTFAEDYANNQKLIGSDSRTREPTAPTVQMQSGFISIPIMTQVRGNSPGTQNDDIQNRSFGHDRMEGIQIFFRSATPLFRFGMVNGNR